MKKGGKRKGFVFNIALSKQKSVTDTPRQLACYEPSGERGRLVADMTRIDAMLGSGQ